MGSDIPTKKQATESNEDRLSQLPDPVLHVILSSLYTNDLVKTCMFGRRWRNLWASMPYLRIGDGIFLPREEAYGKFKQFINTLFQSRDECDVHAFRLGWFKDFDPLCFDSFIQYLVKHNIKLLEINAGECDELVSLPDSFFTCQSLEELSFTCVELSSLYFPEFTSLGRLRKLHLSNCLVQNSVATFIDGCPLLEDLNLQSCVLDEVCILSNKLKSLILRDCRICGMSMAISSPNLEVLHYINNRTFNDRGKGVHCVRLKELSSLLDASVVIDREDTPISNVIDTITELSSATKLECLIHGLEFIKENQFLAIPTFYKLKRLAIGRWHMSNNFRAVSCFLKCSPYLEMLTLKGEEAVQSWKCIHVACKQTKRKSKLLILCPRLRIVELQIKCWQDIKRVKKTLNHLLPNAKILKIHSKSCGSKSCYLQ